MPKLHEPYELAESLIAHMQPWLGLPPEQFRLSVRMIALQLPPAQLTEAVLIAQSKIPYGGRRALRYFLGICRNMMKARAAAVSRN